MPVLFAADVHELCRLAPFHFSDIHIGAGIFSSGLFSTGDFGIPLILMSDFLTRIIFAPIILKSVSLSLSFWLSLF